MATRKKQTKSAQQIRMQFSKKLAAAIIIYWGVIRLISVIATLVNAESSVHMAEIVEGVDQIAMIVVLAYNGNSLGEKITLGYFRSRSRNSNDDEDESDKNG